jgi:hypothetical protein
MSEEQENDGTWSGLKKTIVGVLGTVVTAGGVWLTTLLGGGDKHQGARRETGRLDGGTLVNGGIGGSSRQPGDMDLIPDPYRVGQQFSSASYSFKTDPAPYLADFSAFLR